MILPGARFGPCEVVDRLGAGGMGEVYRARDTRPGRFNAGGGLRYGWRSTIASKRPSRLI